MAVIQSHDLLYPAARAHNELRRLAHAAGLDPDDRTQWAVAVRVQLLFLFLRYSPTYELARQVTQGLTARETVHAPNFEQALITYCLLGDVRGVSCFTTWWERAAAPQLLRLRSHCEVGAMMRLSDQGPGLSTLERRITLLMLATAAPQAEPWQLGTYLGGPKKNYLTWKRVADSSYRIQQAVDSAERMAIRPHVLRTLGPRISRARRAAMVAQSAVERKQLRKFGSLDEEPMRNSLKANTRRSLIAAEAIAENAARGTFPSEAPILGAGRFDYEQLHRELYR